MLKPFSIQALFPMFEDSIESGTRAAWNALVRPLSQFLTLRPAAAEQM